MKKAFFPSMGSAGFKALALLGICMLLALAGCSKPSDAPFHQDAQPPQNSPETPQTAFTPPVEPDTAQDAANIRGQMHAPEALTHSFSSPSGKTSVVIEADVEVPDVARVNLYEVTSREIPANHVTAFADHVIGEGAWTGDSSYGAPYSVQTGGNFDGVTERDMSIESTSVDWRGWPMDSLSATVTEQNGVLRGGQIMSYSSRRDEGNFNYNYFMVHGRRGENAQNCSYTREEAMAIAAEAAAILAPELTHMNCGLIQRMWDSELPKTEATNAEAYLCCFTRIVDGIPVTYTIQECNETDEDENGESIHYRILYPYESLRLVVTSEGITAARYESPYVVSAPLQENASLLPFDQVMDIAEKILPLTFAWLESSYQVVEVQIDRITFGYGRVDFKDDIYRYTLAPVWDFFGTYACYRDGKRIIHRADDYSSLLTINAIDGTVIDRNFGF